LQGCGAKIAIALAKHGFGETLCSAACTLPQIELLQYLSTWRDDVRNFLRTDPIGSMGSQHQALAAAMPNDFPNLETVYLYISPVTSTEDLLRNITLDYHPPDIVKITRLCELYFSWATTEGILGKFESGLFQAVLMAAFCDEVVRREADAVLESIPLVKVCAIPTAVILCVVT
jgi:Holliday junction resolvase YEN1